MPQKIIETIPAVVEELRSLSKQIVHPKDTYFASMAQTVENFAAIAEHEETVIDDLVAKVDRYEKALRDIKRECGERAINAGTSTLGLFVDQILRLEHVAER